MPNGDRVTATCLQVGEFDLLAVNLFAFENKWRFAFANNADLPRSRFSGYTDEQRKYLLATLMEVTWPLKPPFEETPVRLLARLVPEAGKERYR